MDELKNFLKRPPELEANVVVMPDFFFDRFVSLNFEIEAFSEKVFNVVKRKGGNLDGISQFEFRGGNAVNTATALARLGVRVVPIICTNRLGLQLIKFHLKSPMVDLSHVKIMKKPSITTSLEFKTGDGKANVMLRDLGSLADFGPNHLSCEDFEAIEKADFVCVFNWAGTKSYGTDLAETVFTRTKKWGRGKTYCDTADPTPNRAKVKGLIERVLKSGIVDVLSLNENEAVFYGKEMGWMPRENFALEDLAREAARFMASRISSRIDLHTTRFSATFTNEGETVVSAFKVPVLRATGAGDAWNAGNILGSIYGLSDGERLALANAVAAYYISNPEGKHPNARELLKFLKNIKVNQNR
ncbi:MAG: carbohydrate kinase family protein [Candidatus Bathyarchaeia archaeon]